MGVAVPGLTRRADGFVHLAPNLGWKGVEPGRHARRGSPPALERVRVGNEADLGALGEHRRGAGRGCDHLVFVSGEVGIGAGLIIEGRPMLGAAGYAGEAGHMLVNPDGRQCTCGAFGCWETEAGEAALLRARGCPRGARWRRRRRSLERVTAGDEAAVAAVAEIGHWLGVGVGNLVNLLNPEVVVLGGIFQPLFPFLREPMLGRPRAVARRGVGARPGGAERPRHVGAAARRRRGGPGHVAGRSHLELIGLRHSGAGGRVCNDPRP